MTLDLLINTSVSRVQIQVTNKERKRIYNELHKKSRKYTVDVLYRCGGLLWIRRAAFDNLEDYKETKKQNTRTYDNRMKILQANNNIPTTVIKFQI